MNTDVKGRRPRLATPPIYELWLDPEWQMNDSYRLQQWFRWGWCRLDELVELINKQFELHWTKAGLLKRFAIPMESGRILRGELNMFDLNLLSMCPQGTLYCGAYKIEFLSSMPGLDEKDFVFYVPVGWAKDVLWALFCNTTRAVRATDGKKVACTEDGTPVFEMTGAGKTK